MYVRFFKPGPGTSAREVGMNFNQWVRQFHRWLAIVFTLVVLTIFIVLTVGNPPMWLYYTPLPFLFLMAVTGLYMFALPYMSKWRKAQ